MPPKKAKAASTPSLQGCAITFAANAIPAGCLHGWNLLDAKTSISNNGGTYVTKVEECTHLVVSTTQYSKSLAKVKTAQNLSDVHIVLFAWLEQALASKSPVDDTPFLLHGQSQPMAPLNSANGTDDTTKPSKPAKEVKDEDEDDATDTKPSAHKKRKRDTQEDSRTQPEPRATGGGKTMNVTKNLDLKIPLDEGLISKQGSNYTVHVGYDSTIYDVTLNQSDSSANANKFYRMQLLEDPSNVWWTWTRWGRVGEEGQNKMLGGAGFDHALAEFKKKFKDKTGNAWEERATGPIKAKKYAFIERSYEDSDSEGEQDLPGADKRQKVKKEEDAEEEIEVVGSKLPEPTQRLMKLIFNQEYFNNTFDSFNYDAKKMPLGKLSKSSLLRGYEVLKTLSGIVGPSGSATEIETLSNQYLSLIPHVVSRNSRPPVLNNMDMIKKEIELLEALTDMQLANNLMKDAKKSKEKAEEVNLLDRQYQGLGMQEMTPLDPKSSEFTELENYLTKSVGHTHGTRYKVQDIFRIQRNGEFDRFHASEYAKVQSKNRRLLWHGSRATNFGGILSQGLRIAPPEAPATGYMFDKGVYLADMSSKSANYCCSYNTNGTGLLLLCEAELGEPPLKLTNADSNAATRAKQANCISTWGVGQTAPLAWKDAGAVHKSLAGISMPDVVSKKPGPTNEQGAYLQYNEYIAYDVAQIKLRYLFRVSM
ncbi:hypothetical protein OHC33_005013 [Knufia fluminis]|uniref:Poly [ADP-ribose] polymerase n=1 Tax=Knufia fluminis TaxID=191047 RepID=A0AAN8EEG5_9EURO|nr:hypothetical protein OHC33_005013 [Knufia fluminis]